MLPQHNSTKKKKNCQFVDRREGAPRGGGAAHLPRLLKMLSGRLEMLFESRVTLVVSAMKHVASS